MTLSIHNTVDWPFEKIAAYGPDITAAFKKLVDRFPRDITLKSLADDVLSGRQQLWLILDGEEFKSFVTTEIKINDYTGHKSVHLINLAGEGGQVQAGRHDEHRRHVVIPPEHAGRPGVVLRWGQEDGVAGRESAAVPDVGAGEESLVGEPLAVADAAGGERVPSDVQGRVADSDHRVLAVARTVVGDDGLGVVLEDRPGTELELGVLRRARLPGEDLRGRLVGQVHRRVLTGDDPGDQLVTGEHAPGRVLDAHERRREVVRVRVHGHGDPLGELLTQRGDLRPPRASPDERALQLARGDGGR